VNHVPQETELIRVSVAMPKQLDLRIEKAVKDGGLFASKSEFIRDACKRALSATSVER